MKRTVVNSMLALVSVAAVFAVLEVALALFSPQKVVIQRYHEQYHPVMGWVNKPGMRGDFYLQNRSYFFHRTHNGQGLRSLREIPYRKPAGVKRVLLVGDSFFWGYGVDDQSVLSEVLQRTLGPGVEIINGAVSGYGTDQELLWLSEEGVKYQPDLVVVGCFPGNDLDEISHSVNYGYPKPIFSLNDDGLVLNNVPVPDTRETRRKAFEEPDSLFGKVKKFLRHHTHSYPFLARRINAVPGVRHFLVQAGVADEFTTALPGIPQLTLKPEKVRPLFEALLGQMKGVARGAGADLMVVFVPEKESTPGGPILYQGVPQGAETRNSDNSAKLAAITAAQGIRYLDLLPAVRKGQRRGEILYTAGSFDHHWTAAGHRAAAEELYQALQQRLPERAP